MKRKWMLGFVGILLAFAVECGGADGSETDEESTRSRRKRDKTESEIQQTDEALTQSVPDGEHAQSDPEKAPVYDDRLIKDVIAEEGSYSADPEGIPFTYSYHVPELVGDTETIREINREIADLFGGMVEENRKNMQEKDLLLSPRVEWTGYWKDSLLSLCIEWDDRYALRTDYYVVNYDFAQDKWLSNQDLPEYLGVDADTFLRAVKRAAIQEYDRGGYEDPDDWYINAYYTDHDGGSSVVGDRAALLAGFSWESFQVCADQDTCRCILPVRINKYTEDCINYILTPDFAPSYTVKKEVTDGIVTASLEDNQVYISFEDTEEVEWFLPWFDGVGKKYPVQGLFSDYQDIYLGVMGIDYMPYLILVTQDGGRLEFVDIIDCARAGIFCAMPIADCINVAGGELYSATVEDEYGGGYDTIYARTGDGKEYDLSSWVFTAWKAFPIGSWSGIVDQVGNGFEGDWYSIMGNLEISDYGYFSVSKTAIDEEFFFFEGSIRALGMAEDGMIYAYDLWNRDGSETREGAMAGYRIGIPLDDDGYSELMRIKKVSGEPLFDVEGEWIEFYPNDYDYYDAYTGEDTEGDYESNAGGFFIGEWQDSWSGRCYMTIEEGTIGGRFPVTIHWSDSAFNGYEWHLTGIYDRDSDVTALKYDDCVCTYVAYKESGNEILRVEYSSGCGRLYFAEAGQVRWDDYVENQGENCVFVPAEY